MRKSPFTVYLDFDGTVVEHAYPDIGAMNPGCLEVVQSLQKAGHIIILNTYRANIDTQSLNAAVEFLRHEKIITELDGIESHKIDPPIWDMGYFDENRILFIDDICEGIPLTNNAVLTDGKMVDWKKLDLIFINEGIY